MKRLQLQFPSPQKMLDSIAVDSISPALPRMSLLGLKDTLDGLARACGVRWYGHALRRNNNDVLRRALNFEVAGRKERGL